MDRKKMLILGIVILYLLGTLAFFVSADDTTYAQSLIQQKVPCSELNQTQLISIGDYYMSQVFSPEQHEYMDNMMGGDSSQMAENMHLQFAYRYYCNDSSGVTGTNYGYGMMGGYTNGYNPGMMNGYGYNYSPWYFSTWILIVLFMIVAALIAAVIVLAVKVGNKKKRK